MAQFFRQQAAILWIGFAFLLVLGIGYLDYLTESPLSFSVFYLIPVSFSAWQGGKRPGIIIAVAASLMHLLAAHVFAAEFFQFAIAGWNSLMLLVFLLFIAGLLNRVRQLRDSQQNLSRNDTVTTAINSRYFYELLQNEIDRAKRYQRHFTVIYIDLDDFKKVNESFGHKEGDTALWHCVMTISGALRKTDIIGRMGGDEFGCLLPETGFDASETAIERLRAALNKEMQLHKWAATFSLGAVTFAESPNKSDDAIRIVESLMEQVKRAGKNGCEHKVYV